MNIFKLNAKSFEIDWDKLAGNLLSTLWQLALTTLVFYIILKIGNQFIVKYLQKKHLNPKNKRAKTMTALFYSVFHYSVIFFYFFGILSIIGVPIGTLLASASIFSLALGMGAQGFVSDLVNGFFILSEDQFDVGDIVKINNFVGRVVQLGLRTTRLKGADNSIIHIPNRNITVVQNIAHEKTYITINLELAADNDFKKVKEIIASVNQKLKKATPSAPLILGISAQNGQSVTYSVYLQVKFNQQASTRHLFLDAYLKALADHEIKLANNVVINNQAN